MKISELQVGQGKANVTAIVKEVGEVRNINKFGREIKVANAVISDDSGEIKLTLWNQDIEKVKPGDKVKIINGYVNEFNGEKQLTTGKFGSMEVSKSEDFDDSQKQKVSEVEGKDSAEEEVAEGKDSAEEKPVEDEVIEEETESSEEY